MKRIDLKGQTFGSLQVIELGERRQSSGAQMWKCRCVCGNITYATANKLLSGKKKSCGCLARRKLPPPAPEYTPKTDCVSYRPGFTGGCEALEEKLCVTRGQCNFYRSRDNLTG